MNVPKLKELFDMFCGLVFSAQLGITKKDCEIFKYVTDKYGLDINETVFIDDSANNISVAKNIGIDGYLFDGDAEKLRAYLDI